MMEHISLINYEVDKAARKFESAFYSEKMVTMIHRFPEGLAGISNSYIVPRVVAIGPYHHGKEHLANMEEVKKAATEYFCQQMKLVPKEAYKRVLSIVDDARGKYIEETNMKGMKDEDFAAMMFCDACFLLLYMGAYSRSSRETDYLMDPSLQRFLFSKRDSINKDIMLLENQLPWLVVQALMRLVSEEDKEGLMMVVGEFIAGMAPTFKVTEPIRRKAYVWDEEIPPPHLLALLRENLILDEKRCSKKPAWRLKEFISPISPMELEEIGITLTANQTGIFTDMDLEEGWLLGKLSLAPLSLSDIGESWLVNMAALEVCTASCYRDHPNNTAVCSYLALLAMLMIQKVDVHKLRSKGLLYGPHSNKEMLTFFKNVMMHLPDSGSRFAHIMEKIEDYKHKRYIRIKLYKWLYNNYKTIITVLSILATLIGLYRAILSLKN